MIQNINKMKKGIELLLPLCSVQVVVAGSDLISIENRMSDGSIYDIRHPVASFPNRSEMRKVCA